MAKYKDRIKVVNPLYCCADLFSVGTLLDSGTETRDGLRFLVAWDYSPTTIFGIQLASFEVISS